MLKEVKSANFFTHYQNFYNLQISSINPEQKLALLHFGDQFLSVPYESERVCPHLKVNFKASDVLIAKENVSGISARNQIEAEIKEIIILNGKTFLYTQIENFSCLVEMTMSSFQEIQLKKGQSVFLIIKASSIEVSNQV